MNPRPRSFAYCYAKQLLRKRTSKYAPLWGLVCGLALLTMAFMHGPLELINFVLPALILYSAADSWIESGKQEAFQEAERIIEELRASGDVPHPPSQP
ncbi:MAG: hypothetical protein QM790_16425 [Nibricoccus sp.]